MEMSILFVCFVQDGLFLVTESPECVSGYTRAILSPNAMEFQRLYQKMVHKVCNTTLASKH